MCRSMVHAGALEELIQRELDNKGGPVTPDTSAPAKGHSFIDDEAKGPVSGDDGEADAEDLQAPQAEEGAEDQEDDSAGDVDGDEEEEQARYYHVSCAFKCQLPATCPQPGLHEHFSVSSLTSGLALKALRSSLPEVTKKPALHGVTCRSVHLLPCTPHVSGVCTGGRERNRSTALCG